MAHLDKEVKEQAEVETASAKGGNHLSDYFAYASHHGAVRWPAERATVKIFISSGSGVPGFKSEYAGFFADSFGSPRSLPFGA